VNLQKQFNAAAGYYELGMLDEAWQELQNIPATGQRHGEVLALKISVLMQLRRWEQAVACGTEMLEVQPAEKAAYIDIAYCLHELGRTEQAREILLGAVNLLRDSATFHYNMACYEAQLGNLAATKRYLQHSIELDGDFARLAQTDPDLQPLRK
jgi:tetratricopeptide (TPR) repeat protein